nr:MAG TPA: hypothetical protein [Caudoviricetes sp.]
MKEIKRKDHVIEDFGVRVYDYLTYAEIQAIADSVVKLDSWAERQTNIDMLVLKYAASISMDELQKYGHNILLTSGLIEEVMCSIKNIDQLYEAISYATSMNKFIGDIIKLWPKYQKQIEGVIKDGAKRKK